MKRSYGHYLVFEADNVNVEEDIEQCIYSKTEDGKTDFSKAPKRDIKDEYLDKISTLLSDMIYYREKEYDTSELIEQLFEKLPVSSAEKLITKLNKVYDFEAGG